MKTRDSKQAPSSAPQASEAAQEFALKSAMHDIASLSISYRRHQHAANSNHSRPAGEYILPASVVLPTASTTKSTKRASGKSREHWRSLAWAAIALLGLSTSALALSLHRSSQEEHPRPATMLSIGKKKSQLEQREHFPKETPIFSSSVNSPEPLSQIETTPQKEHQESELTVEKRSSPLSGMAGENAHQAQAPSNWLRHAVEDTPITTRESSSSTQGCDEVVCLVDPSSNACCSNDEVTSQQIVEEARVHNPNLREIRETLATRQSKVAGCFDRHSQSGTIVPNLSFSETGLFQSIRMADGSDAFRACVESALSGLRLPKVARPFHITYVYRDN